MKSKTNNVMSLLRRYEKTIAAVIIAVFVIVGFYVRFYPFKNYAYVEKVVKSYGLGDVAKYSYLDANDPWIEYWLAKYLHDHGISSWKTLTRDNPATHIFWYPWGRDFAHSAFPFIPVIGALTPNGMKVVQWVSLIPAIFGTLMVAVGAIYTWLLYGKWAGVAAAILLSVLPASTARTYSGFVEKIGVAMPFLLAFMMFYSLTLRNLDNKLKAFILATASGAFLAAIPYIWGGYAIASAALALTAILIPVFVPPSKALQAELATLVTAVTATFLSIPAELYGPISLKLIVLPAAASVLMLAVIRVFLHVAGRKTGVSGQLLIARAQRYFTILALLLIAIGLGLAGPIGLRGRALFALAWPLRELGLVHMSRLAETVAEHSSPLTTPHLLRGFMWDMNILVFLAPAAFIYLFYRVKKHGEIEHLILALTAAGLYYAVMGMIYFEQAAAVASAVASSALIGFLAPSPAGKPVKRARSKIARREHAEIKALAAITLALLIIAGTLIGFHQTLSFVKNHVAMITGYSKHSIQLAWLYFLNYLRSMPKNVVVVAWWDYGYQISVGGGKPSLADGATINSTQIRLLADFFTSTNEDNASRILKEYFKLKPGKTLIFVHDIVLYNPQQGIVIYIPSIDIPKSNAMLHIAEKDLKGFALINDLYKKTFIYKLFASAPYYIGAKGTIYPEFTKATLVKKAYILWNQQLLELKRYTFKHFKPYLIILGPIFNPETGKPVKVRITAPGVGGDYYEAVIMILYEWTG